MGMWVKYVPVHQRQQQAKKKMDGLRKKGETIEPITIEGRAISKNFWGKKWCDHIESFADYDNRLPRGRTYVRNGSVCHLGIAEGKIKAMVSGSELYHVTVEIKTLAKDKWSAIKTKCSGMIGSILELLQGKISHKVMETVADTKIGLFPLQSEISYDCSCPDWAGMCKHVAAVLYGIGNRLDTRPELLFHLRGVDPQEMVAISINTDENKENVLQNNDLADLFGIDLEEMIAPPIKTAKPPKEVSEPLVKKAAAKKTKEKKLPFIFDPNAITAETIKMARSQKGLSVADFADELGVTPASIYRWEKATGMLKLNVYSKDALMEVFTGTSIF